jgi:WD40 repeat protein
VWGGRFWDVKTLQCVKDQRIKDNAYVNEIVFSFDGALLASSTRIGTLQLWDGVAKVKLGEPWTGYYTRINSVAFNKEATVLASCSYDDSILLRSVKDRQCIFRTGSLLSLRGSVIQGAEMGIFNKSLFLSVGSAWSPRDGIHRMESKPVQYESWYHDEADGWSAKLMFV